MLDTVSQMSGLTSEQRIQNLLDALSAIHGQIHTRREKSGLHVMLACPDCLEEYGRRELRSRHLALNIDKYLGLGEYVNRFATGGKKGLKSGYAMCMKDGKKFTMEELLHYPPLEARGHDNLCSRVIYDGRETKYLVPDGKIHKEDGREHWIPDHPGKVRSILSLPQGHPCLQFIASRDLDPVLLHRHFRAAWCEEEAPEGEQYGKRFWRKHSDDGIHRWYPGCWKSTPQGRLILYSDVWGTQVSWQARYLELKAPVGDPATGQVLQLPFVFHPYRMQWEPRPPWPKSEEPVKYVTAPGSERNSQLCGFDHVHLVSQSVAESERFCVLAEGPLDAARFPNNGMAVLGKYLSDTQALLVRAAGFTRVVLAFDADKAGREACKAAEETLRLASCQTVRFFRPDEGQDDEGNGVKLDPGGITYPQANERLQSILNF
jgi:hypothetical protein